MSPVCARPCSKGCVAPPPPPRPPQVLAGHDPSVCQAVFQADLQQYTAAIPKLPIPGQRNILVSPGV